MAAAYALIAAALFAAALVTTQFGLRHMDGLAGAKISIPSAAALLWPNPYAAVLLGYPASAIAIWLIAAFSRREASRAYTRRWKSAP